MRSEIDLDAKRRCFVLGHHYSPLVFYLRRELEPVDTATLMKRVRSGHVVIASSTRKRPVDFSKLPWDPVVSSSWRDARFVAYEVP